MILNFSAVETSSSVGKIAQDAKNKLDPTKSECPPVSYAFWQKTSCLPPKVCSALIFHFLQRARQQSVATFVLPGVRRLTSGFVCVGTDGHGCDCLISGSCNLGTDDFHSTTVQQELIYWHI